VELNDPLPRLLRLRGALEQSLEDPATIDPFSMDGLRDGYSRLRAQARALAVDLGIDADEFDAIFPEHASAEGGNQIAIAKAAASLLRQLDGYLGGLIQTQAINQHITVEQLELAREAARRPPGFAS
jgi:hypothetical protein